jgi:hypothetical protein
MDCSGDVTCYRANAFAPEPRTNLSYALKARQSQRHMHEAMPEISEVEKTRDNHLVAPRRPALG